MPKGKPDKRKAPQTKQHRIVDRAKKNAAKQQTQSQVNPPPKMGPVNALTVYGSEDKHVHKLSRGLYSDEILPRVEALAAKGYTNDEIAQTLGIGNRTFYDWRARYPQFLRALEKYRGVIDVMVENAFINNCLGYQYAEQAATASGKVVNVLKWHPGETKAQQFYLTNRLKGRWQNKVETTISLAEGMQAVQFSLIRREE